MNREKIIKLALNVDATEHKTESGNDHTRINHFFEFSIDELERFAAAIESEAYQLGVKETLALCNKQIDHLKIGHDRYETARLMNPRMWSVAWEINVNTGKPFDEIIDNMRPFFIGDK